MKVDAMEVDTSGAAGVDLEEAPVSAGKTDPAFSRFMQAFWDLSSVDVSTRCVTHAFVSRGVVESRVPWSQSCRVQVPCGRYAWIPLSRNKAGSIVDRQGRVGAPGG